MLASLASLRPKPLPPLPESVPIEVWTEEQVKDFARGGAPRRPAALQPSESVPLPQEELVPVPEPAEPVLPDPSPADMAPRVIRATRILSGDVLAHPGSRKMREALSQMEEGTRLEQLCNIEAMAQIAAALEHFRPEQVVAYAMADTKVTRTTIMAGGAAFRSGREWFNLAYKCQLTPDRSAVRGFAFSVGAAIPEKDWEAHSLPSPEIDTE